MRFGVDVSSAVGPIDVYVESALNKNVKTLFFEGQIDADTSTLPDTVSKADELITQIVVGAQYSMKYNNDDNVTIGAEYFQNHMGYDSRELELYSLFMQKTQLLYAGERYGAVYLRLPSPGSWNDTAFFFNAIHNFSDKTSTARVTATWKFYKDLTLEANYSQCFGDYGELCFRIPKKFEKFASDPTFTPEEQDIIAALPKRRTKNTYGVALNMSF